MRNEISEPSIGFGPKNGEMREICRMKCSTLIRLQSTGKTASQTINKFSNIKCGVQTMADLILIGKGRSLKLYNLQSAQIVSGSYFAQTFRLGYKLILICKARGDPIPTIKWYKEGSEMHAKPNIHVRHSYHNSLSPSLSLSLSLSLR